MHISGRTNLRLFTTGHITRKSRIFDQMVKPGIIYALFVLVICSKIRLFLVI